MKDALPGPGNEIRPGRGRDSGEPGGKRGLADRRLPQGVLGAEAGVRAGCPGAYRVGKGEPGECTLGELPDRGEEWGTTTPARVGSGGEDNLT